MDLIDFIKSFPLRRFQKGEVLLSAGQDTATILILREGIVKVSSLSDEGNERMLWAAGRYDIIPTENIFSSTVTAKYFYTAFCDGSAYQVDKKELLTRANSDSQVMSQIARGLSEHHDDLLSRINADKQTNLRLTILHTLEVLSEKFSGADSVRLHELGLNLTHQDIADLVHASREAVSIELKKLQDDGFIEYSRSDFVVNAKKIKDEIMASS